MAMLAAVYQSSEYVKIVRRPNGSATEPNTIVPTKSPAKVAAANEA